MGPWPLIELKDMGNTERKEKTDGERGDNSENGREKQRQSVERERLFEGLCRGELIRMETKWREEKVQRIVSQLVKVPNTACGHK